MEQRGRARALAPAARSGRRGPSDTGGPARAPPAGADGRRAGDQPACAEAPREAARSRSRSASSAMRRETPISREPRQIDERAARRARAPRSRAGPSAPMRVLRDLDDDLLPLLDEVVDARRSAPSLGEGATSVAVSSPSSSSRTPTEAARPPRRGTRRGRDRSRRTPPASRAGPDGRARGRRCRRDRCRPLPLVEAPRRPGRPPSTPPASPGASR